MFCFFYMAIVAFSAFASDSNDETSSDDEALQHHLVSTVVKNADDTCVRIISFQGDKGNIFPFLRELDKKLLNEEYKMYPISLECQQMGFNSDSLVLLVLYLFGFKCTEHSHKDFFLEKLEKINFSGNNLNWLEIVEFESGKTSHNLIFVLKKFLDLFPKCQIFISDPEDVLLNNFGSPIPSLVVLSKI